MPNQHNNGDIIYQKCADPDCNNQVRRTPCEVKKGNHIYCSIKCTHFQRSLPRKYKDADINWIIENTGKISRAEMAKKFECNLNALQRMISKWRAAGYAIPVINSNMRGISKYHLTEGQKTWVVANYERLNFVQMEELINISRRFLKNFIDHQLKSGKIFRKPKLKSIKVMARKPEGAKDRRGATSAGNAKHSQRKPPVNDTGGKREERLATRKIDTSGCIKVIFNDKNKTTMYAKDEDHVVRIRKVYKAFEEKFGSQLVYPEPA